MSFRFENINLSEFSVSLGCTIKSLVAFSRQVMSSYLRAITISVKVVSVVFPDLVDGGDDVKLDKKD